MLINTPFYFLRHGETDANLHDVFCEKDCPLNGNGILQAEAVIESIAKLDIQHIFSSPLERALQTATIVNNFLQKELLLKSKLKECNLGILEGQKRTKDNNKTVQKWLAGEIIDNGETYMEFVKRVKEIMNECLTEVSSIPLFVSHGGVFMTLTKQFLGYSESVELNNCSLVYLEPPKRGIKWKINEINKSVA